MKGRFAWTSHVGAAMVALMVIVSCANPAGDGGGGSDTDNEPNGGAFAPNIQYATVIDAGDGEFEIILTSFEVDDGTTELDYETGDYLEFTMYSGMLSTAMIPGTYQYSTDFEFIEFQNVEGSQIYLAYDMAEDDFYGADPKPENVTYAEVTGGTVTVSGPGPGPGSGSGDVYTFAWNFTTASGTPITGSYSGPFTFE